jgi:hypothetical protein
MIIRLSNDYGIPLLIAKEADGETYTLDPDRSVQVEITEAGTNGDPDAPVVDIFVRRELDEAYLSIFAAGGTYTILEESEDDINYDLL